MKATVTTINGTVEVEIKAYEKMTLTSAIALRNVACGDFATATVSGGGKTYRVTGISGLNARARLVKEIYNG